MRNVALSQHFSLELIETIITNSNQTISSHPEQVYLYKTMIMPLITRLLSERLSFSSTVRGLRMFCVLIQEHLHDFPNDFDVPLSLLNHILESEAATPWRRVVAMETFRMIYITPELVVDLYSLFDADKGKQNVIQDNISNLVRLASEKPSLLGTGLYTSLSAGFAGNEATAHEQAAFEASSMAEIIGAETVVSETNSSTASGLSVQNSSIKTSCLDQPDKSDAPQIPDTYIYSLVLACLGGLADNLARTVLPLLTSAQARSMKPARRAQEEAFPETSTEAQIMTKDQMRNGTSIPETLSDLPKHPRTQAVADLLDSCWHGLLACCSTMLVSSLDSEYYRNLIRAIQRFTQTAASLMLTTPRDAFLTTLAKAATTTARPIYDASSPTIPSAPSMSPKFKSHPNTFRSGENPLNSPNINSSNTSTRNSLDHGNHPLTQRNLLCLRALINLAIALGPVLESAWPIIIETLQKADMALASAGMVATMDSESHQNSPSPGQAPIFGEIQSVRAAAKRLVSSTSEFSLESFIVLMQTIRASINLASEESPATSKPISHPRHSRTAISRLYRVGIANSNRFADPQMSTSWKIFSDTIVDVIAAPYMDRETRLYAAYMLKEAALVFVNCCNQLSAIGKSGFQRGILQWILDCIRAARNSTPDDTSGVVEEIHRIVMETLLNVLDQDVVNLADGWDIIFGIIESVFDESLDNGQPKPPAKSGYISARLLRPAFSCLQLISEVLSSVPTPCFAVLISIMHGFATQSRDLNVSLTSITLFWNVSDFLKMQLGTNLSIIPIDKSETATLDVLVDAAQQGSETAAWLLLQVQLARSTRDERTELRNSAIHTIFRILENESAGMPPELLEFCIKAVILPVLETNVSQQQGITSTGTSDPLPLEGSLTIILSGIARLLISHLKLLSRMDRSEEIWTLLISQFSRVLERGSAVSSAAVFTTLAQILAATQDQSYLPAASMEQISVLWSTNTPVSDKSVQTKKSESNEFAYIAYVALLEEIYRLQGGELNNQQIDMMTENLKHCITSASPGPYTSDLDSMTPLQDRVLAFYKRLSTDVSGTTSMVLFILVDLVASSLRRSATRSVGDITLLALAKHAIGLLKSIIVARADDGDVFRSGAVTAVLRILSETISMRYSGKPQGKEPAGWRLAASATTEIMRAIAAPHSGLHLDKETFRDALGQAIAIASNLSYATWKDSPGLEKLLQDEDDDFKTLSDLRAIITPHLKSGAVRSGDVQIYVKTLFENSLIHISLAEKSLLNYSEPLSGLYKIRLGRTFDPPFNPRLRICYDCLDELFELAALETKEGVIQQDAEPADGQRALVRAVLPLLILRCAIPLQMYIADQPLRGLMPLPASQRIELFEILEKIVEFRCDSTVLPANTSRTGIRLANPFLGHLEWLGTLIHRAMALVRQDGELLGAMQRVTTIMFEGAEIDG